MMAEITNGIANGSLRQRAAAVGLAVSLLTVIGLAVSGATFLWQLATEDRYSLTAAREDAYLAAQLNPGLVVPYPAEPGRIIVVNLPQLPRSATQ